MEPANIQNPRKGDLRAGVEIHKNSRESKNFRSIILPTILDAFYGFKKVWFFIALPHTVSNQKNID